MLTNDDLVQLRALGYTGGAAIDYAEVRTGDLVRLCRKNQRWILQEAVRVHSFSNYSHDFKTIMAWTSDGTGKGCPVVVLEHNSFGLPPDPTRHMVSPGYGYEFGVAQRGYWYRCEDLTCRCQTGIDPDGWRKTLDAWFARPLEERKIQRRGYPERHVYHTR